MGIPQQVQRAAAEADEALKQLTQPAPAAAPAAPPANEPAPPAAAVPEPAPPAPVPPPAPSAQPTSADAELLRMRQELATAQGRNEAHTMEMAELRQRLAAMQDVVNARPAAPPAAPTSLITDADRTDFGEDMIDLVQRVVRDSVGATIAKLGERIAQLESGQQRIATAANAAQKSAEELAFDRYLSAIDAALPGWREINSSPAFVDWLQKPDMFSGKIRHQLLEDANLAADSQRVIAFFKAYLQESGQPAPAQPPAPAAPAPQPLPPAPPPVAVNPATLVAPTPTAGPTPAANPVGGRIWTSAEVDACYDARIRGRITAEQFAAYEAEIHRAILENRVRD